MRTTQTRSTLLATLTASALLAGCGQVVTPEENAAAARRGVSPLSPAGGGTLGANAVADDSDDGIGMLQQAVNTGHGITYNGGPIMTGSVNVYYIWYGNWAGNSATTILTDLAQKIGGSPWHNINTLYDDNTNKRVTNLINYAGAANDNYSLGTTINEAGVEAIVANAINTNALPKDTNGIYFVLTSADVINSDGFCTAYCGFHYNGTIAGSNIRYAFVGNPDQCPLACSAQQAFSPNGNPGADGMASIIAANVAQTTTDPDSSGWYNTVNGARYENASLCSFTFGATYTVGNGSSANMRLGTRDFLIQQNWLNTGVGSCGLGYGQLTKRGNGPGSRFNLECGNGKVATGVYGNYSTTYITRLGVTCAPVNQNGTLGATFQVPAVGVVSAKTLNLNCPAGQAVVGFKGNFDANGLKKIGLQCQTVALWNSGGKVAKTINAVGASGGSSFTDTCVKGYVVNRIDGQNAATIGAEQGACSWQWPF